MNYLMLPRGGISDVSVGNVIKNNLEGKRDANIYIAESVSITSSVTTSKTWGESLGIPVSVSGKVFGIGLDSSTDYTYREERSQSTSYSVTKTTDISASMQVPPRKKYLNTALYYKGTFGVEFRPIYTLITRTGFKAIFPEGPAQPVFGVASGNIVITTTDITNISRSEISHLTSRQTEIVAPPDDDRKDTALVESTSEAGLGNVLTREVLDDSKHAQVSGQLIGMPANDE
ncbi:hypothetical protein EAE96_002419 [Botrytis aclada]|nr:hypothetical protein EAE96_002419 [Botrytis aclada]